MTKPTVFIAALQAEFPEDRLTYQKAIATFHPESADEAARFFKLANRLGQKSFITGFGNNLDPEGEPFLHMVTVRTDRLNTLHDVSAADLYVKVGGGYPLKEINLNIASHEVFFPHSNLPYVGSAGGAVAVNLTADLRGHPVPIKRFFIRAEIVTPEGEIIRPGSVAFKSVSGYDIVKIFAPSWGLLGLIVSATFRVVPNAGAEEYADMRMEPIEREHFLSGLDENSDDIDVIYSRKIKSKFDPNWVLPIV
jgi:FAD/FMN-containing dehydrogenase